jgi:hypothetical protein
LPLPFQTSSPLHQASNDDDDEGTATPQYYKLSFPMYDDKEDQLGWLNRREHFFRAQCTRDADKVWLASFHMTRPAQHWYYMLERDAGDIPWHTFKAFCQQRFGPAVGINHLADLARLPFRGSVSDYQDAFLAKMAHTGYLSQEQQVRLFTGGLPDAIRVDVRAASSSSPITRHGACKGVRTAILILCRYRHCGTAATPVVAFPPSARHICINTVSHPNMLGQLLRHRLAQRHPLPQTPNRSRSCRRLRCLNADDLAYAIIAMSSMPEDTNAPNSSILKSLMAKMTIQPTRISMFRMNVMPQVFN